MTIVSADLKFLPAQRPTDTLTPVVGQGGGGYASSPVVQDNISNNVFPNVAPSDRLTGRRQMRRVFPAVLSNENSLAANVSLAFSARQTDANVEVGAFRQMTSVFGVGQTLENQRRNSYWSSQAFVSMAPVYVLVATGVVATTATGDLSSLVASVGKTLGVDIKVGDKVRVASSGGNPEWATVTALNSGAGTATIAGTHTWTAGTPVTVYTQRTFTDHLIAPALTTGSLTAGVQDIAVDRLDMLSFPTSGGPTTPGYAPPSPSASVFGSRFPVFRAGARVLIQHPSTPATREIRVIEFVNYVTGEVRTTVGLTNSYPSGTVVCMLLEVGDLQASVSLVPFSQQAWTRVWQDTAIGTPISPAYSGTIAMNNAGAIEERWVVEFTSTTAFKLTGERLGQIASGNISSDFLPLNPYTSQPYFTLPAVGWGSGWLPGNVIRFNTLGAHSGVWVARVVSPSVAAGTVHADLIITADV